jgi:hypothetical protein
LQLFDEEVSLNKLMSLHMHALMLAAILIIM